MSRVTRFKQLIGLAFVILSLIGCVSGLLSNSYCEVKYDSEGDIANVIIRPPGETDEEIVQTPGGRRSGVYQGIVMMPLDSTVTFRESENAYGVKGSIEFAIREGETALHSYDLKITGPAFKDKPYECQSNR